MTTFSEKVAVVTGGASGIGAAVVSQLRAAGAEVAVADLTPTRGYPAVDVSDTGSVLQFADLVADRFGRCDVLINCAGIVTVGTIEQLDEADWDRSFAVNVRGVWQMARHLLPLMPEHSAIVNVASGAGLRAIPALPAYVASKAAVVGLSQAMAIDLAERQIRVNCVCPGLVDTPLAAATQEARPDHVREAVADYQNYLIKRSASPDELAGSICFLASDAAAYITGSTLAVDGGRTLH
ncbi:SDR family oxidoreductase [Saxibacter everestensis]|uniref:SDR family oxidoreductase n=1 Tax=Saxibacter everestensis TaxID=2909229 RepID=A0ABY8QSX8_9MICO|nr:SDR family oxidoreductase [Brevibacteriaceae bacterium ZFBP1038]